jgi:hypothetical protein
VATGVQAVQQKGVGIASWLVYNRDDPDTTWNRTGPAGLHPERWYVLDPTIEHPPIHFSTQNGYGPSFYESYVEDSACNEYFAFLKLRTIEKLRRVTGWETLILHSPEPPVAVYVNDKKTVAKSRKGADDEYLLRVKAPADVVVIRKQPPADPAK